MHYLLDVRNIFAYIVGVLVGFLISQIFGTTPIFNISHQSIGFFIAGIMLFIVFIFGRVGIRYLFLLGGIVMGLFVELVKF